MFCCLLEFENFDFCAFLFGVVVQNQRIIFK